MTHEEARHLILRLIGDIAPDADLEALGDEDEIQPTLDLDSIDVMNLVAAAAEQTGADIPDDDARRLLTLRAWSEYLAARS